MFSLPDLPFDYSSLEPYIDTETMHLHHEKHHATYVNKLNEILKDKKELLNKPIEELISNLDIVPEDIRTKVRNMGGGHFNHSFFWEIMTPPESYKEPDSDSLFMKQLMKDHGSWSGFQAAFEEDAVNKFGSGWVWLVYDDGRLNLADTSNQDSPVMSGQSPVLGIDLWEHAYYLKYKNVRLDYIKAWWNIVNWPRVEEIFKEVSNT